MSSKCNATEVTIRRAKKEDMVAVAEMIQVRRIFIVCFYVHYI